MESGAAGTIKISSSANNAVFKIFLNHFIYYKSISVPLRNQSLQESQVYARAWPHHLSG
jgi:hypothetical protein